MSDDYAQIMTWITRQTAEGLAFNAGSTFDPPNEMRPWRVQPDLSFGIGMLPYDKKSFPEMKVRALAEKNPGAMLPDKVIFPNLTMHMRMGLPSRMDMGLRLVNVTIPKGYKLSESTQGGGQINTVGLSVRKHFFGGSLPLLSVSGAFNRVFGRFDFHNEFSNMELAQGFTADSLNTGHLQWDVRSYGVNAMLSQTYGHWTPFGGVGLNHMTGSVYGWMRSDWKTAITPSYGEASGKPEPFQSRLLFGVQHEGSFPSYFFNGEVKAYGTQSYKSFILMVGVAAPFRIGADSTLLSKRHSHAHGEQGDAEEEPALRSDAEDRDSDSFRRRRTRESFGPAPVRTQRAAPGKSRTRPQTVLDEEPRADESGFYFMR